MSDVLRKHFFSISCNGFPIYRANPLSMSKHHLRKEKICENCGHEVDRFCNSCGQENIETRQSFGHLVRHFVEDFTHYEGNFWKTIKYLLFRPAYLTKTYLAGKRVSYVAPVKLYIFISFVAFFLPGILPHFNKEAQGPSLLKTGLRSAGSAFERLDNEPEPITFHSADSNRAVQATFSDFRSPEAYDSVQRSLPPAQRDDWLERYFNRRLSHLNTLSGEVLKEKMYSNLVHNFPKALFIYLPIFALIIWLFHGKKRWFFFDHGIFTLHYFSFLLLLFTLLSILKNMLPWHLVMASNKTNILFILVLSAWSIYYFFRAHHKMYGEQRIISWSKSVVIYGLNTLLFLVLLLAFVMFTIVNLH